MLRLVNFDYFVGPANFFVEQIVQNKANLNELGFLFRSMCKVFLFCHWMALVWLFLGENYPSDFSEPWILENAEFMEYNIVGKYCFSFYFIMTTVSTVGYGDYTAGTRSEILFVLFLEFVGFCFFGLMMYSVSAAFKGGFDFDIYADNKMDEAFIWMRKVEKSNYPYYLSRPLFTDMY
jgi:voltage-gated potassium channel